MLPDLLSTFIILFQMMCVIVVFAYLITRTRYYSEVMECVFSWKNQVFLAVVFGILSIYGSESGIEVLGAPVNIRDLGPMVAGLAGGPLVGICAGLIGAAYRLTMGGFTLVPCSLATILAGLLAGLIFLANGKRFPGIPLAVTFAVLMEGMHMALVLLIARPFSEAIDLVSDVAFPMIAANAAGMFIFAFIITNLTKERKTLEERDRYQRELERKKAELQIAREIQESFLPERVPDIPGYAVAARTVPAREVGGDFYDMITFPDGRTGFVIADVSDKGVPAALFMALSSTLMRANVGWHHHARAAVEDANRMIAAESKSGMFVTLFLAILDPAAGNLACVNAGHNPPVLVRKAGATEMLPTAGIALGAVSDAQYEEVSVPLHEGDVLVFYTDGVTEAMDESFREFGEDRLVALARECRSAPAAGILESIMKALADHSGSSPQSDDITLMVLKVGQ